MRLLSFLRIVEEVQPRRGKGAAPPRNRRLELEVLERRAVLTLLGETLALPLPIEEPITIAEQFSSAAPEISTGSETTLDVGGSGSGAGEPEPQDQTTGPLFEVPVVDGGSGSGSGEPETGGSGGGGGSDESNIPPELTLSGGRNSGNFVWLTGSVTDLDGPVEGLTVYFTIGLDTTISFTATVQAGGSYESPEMLIALGTLVSAYTIDVDGNRSELVTIQV